MHSPRPRSSLSLWIAILVGPVGAFAPLAHGQSLIALYQSARDYDAPYQAARAQFEANLARAEQARAGVLPTVGLSAGASYANVDVARSQGSARAGFPSQNVGVNATQPIYRPANWATYEQGQRQIGVAQALRDTAEQDLIIRISQAYFGLLAAQDTLTLVRAQETAVSQQLASAQRNFEIGTATITDSREAQARFDLVRAQEIAAENDLQVKKLALDQVVGQPGSAPLPLATPAMLPVPTPDNAAVWVDMAQQVHPAIRQALLGVEVATLEVEKAEAGHKPTVDATLGYNVTNSPNGSLTSTTRSRVNAASVGVTFNLPLFADFATENRIKETLALEDQSRAQLESTRRGVTQATRAAWLSLISGVGQVRALEAAEASSQSALEANQLGYQVGVRINIDVLNAQSQLYQTKRDLAQARYNVLLGNLKLRQANGTLTASDLAPVNITLETHASPSGSAPTTPRTEVTSKPVMRSNAGPLVPGAAPSPPTFVEQPTR